MDRAGTRSHGSFGEVKLPAEILLDLTRRYTEAWRHYHTIEHVADMLQRGARLALSDEQILAIWYHDAVYVPDRPDNEEASAALAVEQLTRAGLADESIALVERIVLDTKTHEPSLVDSAAVIDLDLASLAAPWEGFCENRRRIRAEASFLDDAEFERRTEAFMQGMLARDRLFWTDWGRELEAAARRNLERSLSA